MLGFLQNTVCFWGPRLSLSLSRSLPCHLAQEGHAIPAKAAESFKRPVSAPKAHNNAVTRSAHS